MKITILVFFFFLLSFSSVSGQMTFTSPYTQHFNPSVMEPIDRTIVIDKDKIIITTETEDGKDVYTLMIKEETIHQDGDKAVFYCTSVDGLYETTLLFNQNADAPYIEIFQPNPDAPDEIQNFRILLD